MGLVGKHTAHILETQSGLRWLASPQCPSRIALRLRYLLTSVLLFAAVPAVTRPVFAGQAAGATIVDRNIFEIAPCAIGDTKVLTTIVGGNITYEAAAK